MTGLDLILRGTVVLAAAILAAAAMRRASAAARHLVWTAAFAALLLLPAAIGWGPKLPVRALPAAPVAAQATLRAATAAPATSGGETVIAEPQSRTPWLFLAYLGGLLLVATRFARSAVRTARMARSARPAVYAQRMTEQLRRELRIARAVRVLESGSATVPMTWGVARPLVMLPLAAGEWPAARLHAVVLHELVHVQRCDLLAQVVAQAACCLYWFHPLVWFGAARLRKERERACDDAVLGGGVAAAEYAGHMLELARAMVAQRASLADAPAMAEAGDLEARVREVLDTTRNRTPLTRRMAVCTASMTAVLVLAAATVSLAPAQAAVVHTVAVHTVAVHTVAVHAASAPASTPAPAAVPIRNVAARRAPRTPLLLAMAAAVEEPQAPANTGTLSGIVRDPSGARVPGSSVLIKNLEGRNQETAKANMVGEYSFTALPPGRYAVEVRQPGFAIARAEVAVTAATPARADVNLNLGQISEAMTITGAKPAAGATPPVAPAAVMPQQRIPIGGNVQAAKLLKHVRPEYPAELKAQGITGVVMIRAIISKTGEPLSPEVVNTAVNPGLAAAALDAVRQWRYQPTLLNGQPVEVVTTIDIRFELEQ